MTAQKPCTLERLATGTYLEGLAYDPQRKIIWFSDVAAGGVRGIKCDGSELATLNPGRMWTGGVLVNGNGEVLSSGQGGIMWHDPDTGKSGWLLSEIDGAPINGINEMVPDGCGGLFFGTVDLDSVIKGAAPGLTSIFRLTSEREVIRLCDGIGFTNGMMYDAARARFYCNDTFKGTWAFDVSDELELSNQQMFFEKDDADGMALDSGGNIWITGFRSNAIMRLTPDGARMPDVEIGSGPITQVRFGGPDMRDLYINTVSAQGGAALKEGNAVAGRGSHLYCTRSDMPGMVFAPPEFRGLEHD
jgi:sugar lactone lactonase YvrE